MVFYFEGFFWWLLVADCLIYNILAWSRGKWHDWASHWLSPYFPIHKGVGIFYVAALFWIGWLLYRMQIIFQFLN